MDAQSTQEAAGSTRRSFIRGVAQAGAGTFAAAALLDAAGVDLLADAGAVPGGRTEFSCFRAIAASSADAVEVPAGYRADVLISWGDEFGRPDGTTFTYGFNNDFLAFLPLRGKPDEGLLFVNHEYPSPFFLHGQEDAAAKTAEQLAVERYSVGNSVLHVRRPRGGGAWQVIESPFNRRITGDAPVIAVTGPLAGRSGLTIQGEDGPFQVEVGAGVAGSLANCSGGVTPWSTVLSCEENFQDYGADNYGWGGRYEITSYADYGWVVEHDPYDPASTPRKHTALGRFRHENAAYRHVRGKRFVLYMGDDSRNEGVYKFVSDRRFVPGDRANNLRILESGTLYIARWAPEGRRRFREYGDTRPITPAEGRGRWVPVREEDLVDTARNLRARFGTDTFDEHFATNRPEDLEVGRDGSVYIAFTNNDADGVNDAHGAIRRLRETDDDPTATTFTWRDYASGGPTNRRGRGTRGFSSCDNLVFDEAGNLWIVTDISSSSLRGSTEPKREYAYHRNNAVFMIPRSGPNRGVAFRFANMPVEAEGTGPYFTPDGSTLFINVQHPGEETPSRDGARPDDPQTFSSWWPDGNRTAGTGTPSKPRPSTVMVTREAGR